MKHYFNSITLRNSIFAILFVLSLPLCAQISTLNRIQNVPIEQPVIIKYDSLTNIEFYNKNNGPDTDYSFYSEGSKTEENLSHLIGQRLYFYGDTTEMANTSWLKFYKTNNAFQHKLDKLPLKEKR